MIIGWLLYVIILGLIIFIVLGLLWWYWRKRQEATQKPPPPQTAPYVWGQATASDSSPANTCQMYQFPPITVNGQVAPGTPTLNYSSLSSLHGTSNIPVCLDVDQIVAQQVQHTCRPLVPGLTGPTICYEFNGGTTGPGGIEVFYMSLTNTSGSAEGSTGPPVGCATVPACPGSLSVISVNYQAPGSPPNCLVNNGPGALISMAPCNIAASDQIFRITRANPGQTVVAPGTPQTGLMAQFLDRNTGLCIVPSSTTQTLINGCPPVSHITGQGLTMGPCGGATGVTGPTGVTGSTGPTGSFNNGFDWILIPNLQSANGTVSPQQIAYVDGLSITGLTGGTSETDIINWLQQNNVQTMWTTGVAPTQVILQPFRTDLTNCTDSFATAQYLNYSIYNTLIQYAACTQNGQTEAACLGF